MDTILIIIGFIMIYTTGHLLLLQSKRYEDRTDYEKVVTWIAGISIVLTYLGAMYN